jgi:MFS family permease
VLGGALLCLSLGLSQQAGAMIQLPTEQQAAHNNPYLLAGATVLFVVFVAVEARRSVPLVPLGFFRSGTFSASSMLSLLLGVVLIVALVNVPLFAYAVLGESHLGAGLTLLRLTVMIPVGAFIGGWLVSHVGARWVAISGMAVIVAGFLLMSRWTTHTEGLLLTAGTVVAGFGFGLVLPPISATALQTTESARFGVAAAISTTLRMVGMILGLAALTSWEINRFQQLFARFRAVPAGMTCPVECQIELIKDAVQRASAQAMAEIFVAAAVMAGLALLPALLLRSPRGTDV